MSSNQEVTVYRIHSRLWPGWHKHPPLPGHSHPAVTSVLPGWQLALLVTVAALLAAALDVAVCRMRAARRSATSSAT